MAPVSPCGPFPGLWLGAGSGECSCGYNRDHLNLQPHTQALQRVSDRVLALSSSQDPHLEEGGDAFGSRLPKSGDDNYPRINHTEPGGRKQDYHIFFSESPELVNKAQLGLKPKF